MRILVLNSGSSSLKYQILDTDSRERAASGQVERIGTEGSALTLRCGEQRIVRSVDVPNHRVALSVMLACLAEAGVLRAIEDLDGVAHRVAHGGDHFSSAVRIDAGVIARIRECSELAPLHNPPNLLCIEIARELAPDRPHVAVFDTAFHQQLPPHAYTYALPLSLQRDGKIRRYGFHGSSHAFVSRAASEWLETPLKALRLITLHLGNGASIAAIRDGHSIDTSMGFTPLEGLVMGTRSGDLDPAILVHLARRDGLDADGLEQLLNRESGLLGLCGAQDMREVLERAGRGDPAAGLAIEVFCYRVRKYVGAYLAILGGLDALIFTAGIGEHAHEIRERCCQGLDFLGICVDPVRNQVDDGRLRQISPDGTAVRVLVVPTDEELELALAAARVIDGD